MFSGNGQYRLFTTPINRSNSERYVRYRHNTNNDLLRCAFICALNLGHNPTAATTHALIISVSLKPDHAAQPPGAKYTVINGCTLTDAELRKRLSGKEVSGDEQVDAMELSADFLRKKGGLGLARFVMMEREMKLIDFVSIVLPDQKTARSIQKKHDWRDDWVSISSILPCIQREFSYGDLLSISVD